MTDAVILELLATKVQDGADWLSADSQWEVGQLALHLKVFYNFCRCFMLLSLLSVLVRDVYLAFWCVLSHNLSNLLQLVVFENIIVHGESFKAGLSREKSEQRGHAFVLITSKPLALL